MQEQLQVFVSCFMCQSFQVHKQHYFSKNGFCVLQYTRTQSHKSVQRVFVRHFHRNHVTYSTDLEMPQKHKNLIMTAHGCMQGRRIWMTASTGRDSRQSSRSICANPQKARNNSTCLEIVYKIHVSLKTSNFSA